MGLPLQNTSVSVNRSISQIIGYLTEIGFDDVMQRNKSGHIIIYAVQNKVPFQFEANIESTVTALINDKGNRVQSHIRQKDRAGIEALEKINMQSKRIAWRLICEKVKADRDAIIYGTLEIGETFGGFLMMPDKDGVSSTLGKQITMAVATGKFNLNLNPLAPLLITQGDPK